MENEDENLSTLPSDSIQVHDLTSQEYSSCSILKFNKKDGYRQRNVRQFLQSA